MFNSSFASFFLYFFVSVFLSFCFSLHFCFFPLVFFPVLLSLLLFLSLPPGGSSGTSVEASAIQRLEATLTNAAAAAVEAAAASSPSAAEVSEALRWARDYRYFVVVFYTLNLIFFFLPVAGRLRIIKCRLLRWLQRRRSSCRDAAHERAQSVMWRAGSDGEHGRTDRAW